MDEIVLDLNEGSNEEDYLLLHLSNLYEELSTIYKLGEIFSETIDREDLIQSILPLAKESSESDAAYFLPVTAEDCISVQPFKKEKNPCSYIKTKNGKTILIQISSDGILHYIVQQKHTVIVNNFQDDQRMESPLSKKLGLEKVICAPLFGKSAILGFLLVGLGEGKSDYTAGKGKMLTAIAQQFANCLENIGLQELGAEKKAIETQMKLAHETQMKLFPNSNPIVLGLDLAGKSLPALSVGGDYYDFIPLEGGLIAVIIADVAGKGFPAALLMTMIKGICRTFSFEEKSPGDLMQVINNLLHLEKIEDGFITMIAGVYDPGTSEFVFSNAGHNPLTLWNSNSGVFSEIFGKNLPLGIVAKEKYLNNKLKLSPEDILVLYSDGVTEAQSSRGEEFSSEKLEFIIKKNLALNSKSIVKEVLKEVENFRGDLPQMDDITIVVFKRKVNS